jgi:hypothetical protein
MRGQDRIRQRRPGPSGGATFVHQPRWDTTEESGHVASRPFGSTTAMVWCSICGTVKTTGPLRKKSATALHRAERIRWRSPLARSRLSFGLVATFMGLLAVLHFLEPEFNSGHLISEYQLGRHGWMMSLAFCSFGVGAMLLAQVIPPHLSTRGERLSAWGLWLIGGALFAAGLCPPIATRPIVAYVHGVSGLVVILGCPVVFLLASWSLVRAPAWQGTSRFLRWATALAWAGFLSFLASTAVFAGRAAGDQALGLHPAISISNRLMITTYSVWFAVAAWGRARRAS